MLENQTSVHCVEMPGSITVLDPQRGHMLTTWDDAPPVDRIQAMLDEGYNFFSFTFETQNGQRVRVVENRITALDEIIATHTVVLVPPPARLRGLPFPVGMLASYHGQ